jgi:capsule biosynthesis phosphatase
MKKILIDLDGTLTKLDTGDYRDVLPNIKVIEKLKYFKKKGFTVTVFTARNMKTYNGNVGKINIHTLPIIIEWLEKNCVPYDEVIVGKPWCGKDGFYVDDKAIRPSEFERLSHEEIISLLEHEKQFSN